MNTKNILLEQLTACFDQSCWFVSLKQALDGLTAEQAAWKASEDTNSIWEIVHHLHFYNQRYYDLFQGLSITSVGEDYNTFAQVDGLSWQETVDRCYQILSGFREAIENSGEEKMDSPARKGDDSNWDSILAHVTIHNAYHTGQIVHIRKAQNAWNAAQGVKG